MKLTTPHPVFHDLQNSFENYAERIAIIDKDGAQYTYKEFENHILGAYQNLLEKGIKKGSKVLVAVPMSMELYAILEALFAHGAIAIFLDPWMKGKKMGSVINQVQPDLFIVTKKLSRITWLLPATWKLKKWKVNGASKSNDSSMKLAEIYQSVEIADEDNALITFTSGTSGNPKGANRTFAFLLAQAETLKAHLGAHAKASVDYTNFPIVGLANFALGNTVAIPQINLMKLQQSNPADVITQLDNQGINRLIVSPSLLRKVLAAIDKNHTLKTVMTGGAPISIQLVKTALEKCPTIYFEAIYGSTEAEPICITTFTEINKQLAQPLKGVYVGAPVPEIDLEIVALQNKPILTEEFESLKLQEGEIGEIVVTGNHVNKQYYENPTAFAKNKIVDVTKTIWHRTGDLGYLEDGVLYLVGRDHRIIEHNNQLYYPYPIEQYIELEFGISDLGYVKNQTDEICLYYFNETQKDEAKIEQAIKDANYPVDRIIKSAKPLPRDARHKSKLQIEKL
ncbi:MAG: acyl-CoA synthetase (AMP-forming)/AMP-acid ligase II [Crocinitomix sp.]|jgi:acyl-CoA synthetase (AMP-forming)/AMP-acid ligase II